MARYADFPVIFLDYAQTAFALGSGTVYGPFYFGDWSYLHLWIDCSAAVNSIVSVDIRWNLGENPGSSVLAFAEDLTTYVRAAGVGGYAYWCIPVRAPYGRITVSSNNGVPVYSILARASNVRAQGSTKHIINTTTPAAAGGVTTVYSEYSMTGRARISGYLFCSAAGGDSIVEINEINRDGTFVRMYYRQKPATAAAAVANYVEYFDTEIPLNGKALVLTNSRNGVGINNAFVDIQPYTDNGE